jgi:hypothetical protein
MSIADERVVARLISGEGKVVLAAAVPDLCVANLRAIRCHQPDCVNVTVEDKVAQCNRVTLDRCHGCGAKHVRGDLPLIGVLFVIVTRTGEAITCRQGCRVHFR